MTGCIVVLNADSCPLTEVAILQRHSGSDMFRACLSIVYVFVLFLHFLDSAVGSDAMAWLWLGVEV